MPETKLAETCACGAQFSVSDNYHTPSFVYDKLTLWREHHLCPLRRESPERPPNNEGEETHE